MIITELGNVSVLMTKNQRTKTLILSPHAHKTEHPSISMELPEGGSGDVISTALFFIPDTSSHLPSHHCSHPDLHLWHQTQSGHFSGLLLYYSLVIESHRLVCITECKWSLTREGGTLTETQVFSRKLPLMVVGKLGGVDVYVVVPMDALNDFPLDLVFWLLSWEQFQIKWMK